MSPRDKSLSLKEARQIVLSAQGLAHPNPFGQGLAGAQRAIEHLGYVQIDTISVVERAHNHVWWSRVRDFQPTHLDQLLEKKTVFEYWSHAASYLPMRDFRYSLPRKRLFATGKRQWFAPTDEHLRLKKRVLARIRSEGPLAARDFTSPQDERRSGWWDWKPAKRALEQLFMEGRLMVSSRKGFQKIYDLTERVLPEGVDTSFPGPEELARHLARRAITAHGLVRADEMAYLRPSLRKVIETECEKMRREGELDELTVEGVERPYYALSGEWEKLAISAQTSYFHILSPFDNQVIQRKRLKELFNFDYTIECYAPEAKRQFGYFCLPVLRGDRFVGRIDAKAERAQKVLAIRSFHVERGCGRKADVWYEAQKALNEFTKFNGCENIQY